jgi:hypothetical protein
MARGNLNGIVAQELEKHCDWVRHDPCGAYYGGLLEFGRSSGSLLTPPLIRMPADFPWRRNI